MEQLQTSSHMLKHALEQHGDEVDMGKIEWGVKVLRFTRSAFERQVIESVLIQENRFHYILNSKSEYNRCSLPRLTAKLGEREWKKKAKEERLEKEKELELEKRIIELRKAKCNGRRGLLTEAEKPAEKRRKLNEEEWKRVIPYREEEQRKRKEKDNEKEPEVKKRKTLDIRDYLKSNSEDNKTNQDDLEAQMPANGIKEKDEEQQQMLQRRNWKQVYQQRKVLVRRMNLLNANKNQNQKMGKSGLVIGRKAASWKRTSGKSTWRRGERKLKKKIKQGKKE